MNFAKTVISNLTSPRHIATIVSERVSKFTSDSLHGRCVMNAIAELASVTTWYIWFVVVQKRLTLQQSHHLPVQKFEGPFVLTVCYTDPQVFTTRLHDLPKFAENNELFLCVSSKNQSVLQKFKCF